MKHLILSFILFSAILCYAENDTTKASSSEVASTSQELIELKINKEVRNELWQALSMYGSIAGVFLLVLGFFGYTSYKSVKEIFSENLKNELKKFIEKEVDEKYTGVFESNATDIKRLNFRSELNQLRLEFREKKNSIKDRSMVLQNVKELFKRLLKFDDQDLIVQYIDSMIYMHFELREDSEISRIVKDYGDKYQLTYISWATSAISNMDLYELHGSEEYRTQALKSSDQALKILPGYGTAMAIKIIVDTIAYTNKGLDRVRAKKEIDSLLSDVNSGSIELVSFETWSYLSLLSGLKKYVDVLFTDFKEEMDRMVQRYQAYLTKNPKAI